MGTVPGVGIPVPGLDPTQYPYLGLGGDLYSDLCRPQPHAARPVLPDPPWWLLLPQCSSAPLLLLSLAMLVCKGLLTVCEQCLPTLYCMQMSALLSVYGTTPLREPCPPP